MSVVPELNIDTVRPVLKFDTNDGVENAAQLPDALS